jgi:hypothetical protein
VRGSTLTNAKPVSLGRNRSSPATEALNADKLRTAFEPIRQRNTPARLPNCGGIGSGNDSDSGGASNSRSFLVSSIHSSSLETIPISLGHDFHLSVDSGRSADTQQIRLARHNSSHNQP